MSDAHNSLDDFKGTARLFPLPNLVFFPHALQPLHIFEPRYRQMTADALDGDRFIALVLPHSGGKESDAGKPALSEVACLGRIIAEHRLDDGRFNILLRGECRLRILGEIEQPKLYRAARTEVLDEMQCPSGKAKQWRERLREQVPAWLEGQEEVRQQFAKLLKGKFSLGAVCDILTFALPLEAEFKQSLLEEIDVAARLEKLHRQMTQSFRRFPPFSAN